MMTKIFSLFSTWTNRRQPWGRWTTVGWGSTSRFLHQNICVGTKLVIITMFRNWYCFYSIYAELWTYKFSFNHLIDIFMQYCCKKKMSSWFFFLQLEISIAEMEKANSRFDFLSQFFLCLSHFHFHITFILFSLSYHFHFHITFIRLIGHSGSLLLRFHVNINIKLFHFYFFSISLWLSFNHFHIM